MILARSSGGRSPLSCFILFDLPRRGRCLAEKRTGGIISFFPGLAWPTLFSGPQLGQRRRGRAVRSFRQAPRPPSSRQDRSTAQLPPTLVQHGRATAKLHSKLAAFGPPCVISCPAPFARKDYLRVTKAIRSPMRRPPATPRPKGRL